MGASVVNKDWADELIADANEDQAEFVRKVTTRYSGTRLPIKLSDIATLPQSMAFSLTSMGAGLGVGLPIALIPEPTPASRIAAWILGTAASGAVAFNMSSYQIMQSYLEVKNEEMKAAVGRELTLEEENQLKRDFSSLAIKYGLWEAVPEALSNLAFGKLLTMPLGKMVGRKIASKMLSKVVGIYGEELLAETITEMGQFGVEVEAGLASGKLTWIEAFKRVAPQTFLLTTILGGAGQVSVSAVNRVKKSLKKEIGDTSIYAAINGNITEDLFAEVEAEAVEVTPEAIVEPVAPEVVPKLPVPQIIVPEQGDHSGGDTFTTPEGEFRLNFFSTLDNKWNITLPDGATSSMTTSEIDENLATGTWRFKKPEVTVPERVTPPEAIVHRGTEPEGIAIADELGLKYEGLSKELGMAFTDVRETGSTFHARTLEAARTKLADMKKAFAEAKKPPVVEKPAVPEVVRPRISNPEVSAAFDRVMASLPKQIRSDFTFSLLASFLLQMSDIFWSSSSCLLTSTSASGMTSSTLPASRECPQRNLPIRWSTSRYLN